MGRTTWAVVRRSGWGSEHSLLAEETNMTTHPKRSWLTRPLALVITLSLVASQSGSSAQAANGDNLRTIIADETGTACVSINAQGDSSSVGIGIAFNGANLLISCEGDSTVTVISPTDGSQVPPGGAAVHFIM